MSKFRRLARVEEGRNAYRFLVGKFFGKRPVGRLRETKVIWKRDGQSCS